MNWIFPNWNIVFLIQRESLLIQKFWAKPIELFNILLQHFVYLLYQGKTHTTTIIDFTAKVFYRIHTKPLISGTYYLLFNDIP